MLENISATTSPMVVFGKRNKNKKEKEDAKKAGGDVLQPTLKERLERSQYQLVMSQAENLIRKIHTPPVLPPEPDTPYGNPDEFQGMDPKDLLKGAGKIFKDLLYRYFDSDGKAKQKSYQDTIKAIEADSLKQARVAADELKELLIKNPKQIGDIKDLRQRLYGEITKPLQVWNIEDYKFAAERDELIRDVIKAAKKVSEN